MGKLTTYNLYERPIIALCLTKEWQDKICNEYQSIKPTSTSTIFPNIKHKTKTLRFLQPKTLKDYSSILKAKARREKSNKTILESINEMKDMKARKKA